MTDKESECWDSAQRWHEKYLKAEAEIERLRAALQDIATNYPGDDDDVTSLAAIARRALEHKP